MAEQASGLLRISCRPLIDEVDSHDHGAQDLRIRTPAKPVWGFNINCRYQSQFGRSALHPSHDQLAFMVSYHATLGAGELGPIKQNEIAIRQTNPAYSFIRQLEVPNA